MNKDKGKVQENYKSDSSEKLQRKEKMQKIKKWFFVERLWTGTFTYWWIVSAATVILFDIFWMMQTTFRGMSYFAFYPVWFLSAFFLALPSLLSRNGVLQTIWLLFFDMLFIANLMYCRTYYNAIPLESYALAGNLKDFSSSVIDSFKWYFIFLPVLTLVAFTIYSLSNNLRKRLPSPWVYMVYVGILAIITWASDAWRGGIMKRMDFMSGYAYLSSSIVPIYSLGGYLVHDYYKATETLSAEDKETVVQWLKYHEELNRPYWNDSTRAERAVPKNLVFILCESLESWVIDTEVEGKIITPNLNRIVADSTTFFAPNVVTQVGSGRSIEGQLLTLTGLMPMYNKVYAYDAVENRFFSLPKVMQQRGADTYLLTPDKPYVWNQGRVAPAFGFTHLIDESDFTMDELTGRTKRLGDRSLFRQIAEKMESGEVGSPDTPLMVLTVTNSGHNPFNLPEHLRTISFSSPMPGVIKDYLVTAHYTDASIQILIDYLKQRDDWAETMVVITGDHEGLATDRREALANEFSREFVDPLQHTPLIVMNSPVPGYYGGQLGQADVYSTVLDLLNAYDYPWKGMGISVFHPLAPGVAVGSAGDVVGDASQVSPELLEHMQKARKVSDLILKFDLLQSYPDSIRSK
ncbi:MAG: LTA synthase family protein [Muribaculaceae bacterium]|nr:LTA synthase family protein [Muribaculaceae bacterium]